ncbi:MAG TPA: DHA2 family efflux MFS transporter permease subunit, partial [Armatimonadota bacterium]
MAGPKQKQTAEYTEYSAAMRMIILVALMLGVILEVLDTSIVNVAIPDMMGNLGATLDQISWVSTGYIIANVIVLPLTGWLSAHFGRRRYLGWSMIIFTVASLFCGMSRTLNMLVFFRIMQGVGGAALLSTAQATLMEIFPPKQLGMIQGIFGIGVMVGPTVGPTLGGWITDNYSWPWIFFINLPIGILATVLTFMFVHDSKIQKKHTSVDFIGIFL